MLTHEKLLHIMHRDKSLEMCEGVTCQYMDKGNCGDCEEKLLTAYEDKIRADYLTKVIAEVQSHFPIS